MRALIAVVVVLAALWSGYWVVGSRALEASAKDWFVAQAAAGGVAEHQGLSVAGFPNRFDLTVEEVRLADPATGFGWQAPFVQVFSLSYKPWHVIAALPNDQRITTPLQDIDLGSGKLQGSLIVEPGTDLTLDRITIVGEALTATSSLGWRMQADTARVATRQDPSRENGHEIGVEVLGLTPDPALMAMVADTSDLPATVEIVKLDARAALTGPLDRNVGQNPPGLAGLEVREGLIRWGDMVLFARGTVTAGPDGLAEGRIEIRVENWRKALPVALASGLLPPEMAQTMERGLELLALQSGNPEVLNLPLAFQQGRMSLGPLPLGPAPRMN